jgi:hypothetical protein
MPMMTSCHQGPDPRAIGDQNRAKGIYLANPAFSRGGDKCAILPRSERVPMVALLNRKSDVNKTNVTFRPVGGWTRQRVRIVVIDPDRNRENEICWLDWSERRAKEGFTELFEVIGLTPVASRREALEIVCTIGHVVTGGPPRFAVWTCLVPHVTDVQYESNWPQSLPCLKY